MILKEKSALVVQPLKTTLSAISKLDHENLPYIINNYFVLSIRIFFICLVIYLSSCLVVSIKQDLGKKALSEVDLL